jgi:hypothetical protein
MMTVVCSSSSHAKQIATHIVLYLEGRCSQHSTLHRARTGAASAVQQRGGRMRNGASKQKEIAVVQAVVLPAVVQY